MFCFQVVPVDPVTGVFSLPNTPFVGVEKVEIIPPVAVDVSDVSIKGCYKPRGECDLCVQTTF